MSRRGLLGALALLLPGVAVAQPKKKSIPLTLAFVNFIGKDAEEIAGQDIAALMPLFDRVENRTTAPKQIPTCQVLFLYAQLEPDGMVRGTKWSVRDMVLLSKASIVVVASPNAGESIVKAASAPGPKSANMFSPRTAAARPSRHSSASSSSACGTASRCCWPGSSWRPRACRRPTRPRP